MDLTETAAWFQGEKVAVIEAVGLSKDALHIYFGLTLFVVVRLLWRRRGGWWLAWFAALAIALGGEWLDLAAEQSRGDVQPWAAHWHDIWNTMFWPTALLLVGKWLQPRGQPVVVSADEHAERGLE